MLARPSRFLQRVLRLTGLDSVLIVHSEPPIDTVHGARPDLSVGAGSEQETSVTSDGQDASWVSDLHLARAFVEFGRAHSNTQTDPDEPAPDACDLALADNDHRLWGRLADLCVELLDVDAAAVFVLDDGIEQNL